MLGMKSRMYAITIIITPDNRDTKVKVIQAAVCFLKRKVKQYINGMTDNAKNIKFKIKAAAFSALSTKPSIW